MTSAPSSLARSTTSEANAATFVDHDRPALDAVKVNLVTTGLYARASVVQADVLEWLTTASPYDVAFADPPYAFSEWPSLLGRLRADLVVLESNREIEVEGAWKVLKSKHYGGTVVTMAEPKKGNR